jgi:hypothetical protein
MLALRTQIPHTVWAQDPQAAWTAAELLGWVTDEDQEVAANDELWRRTIQDDQRRPPANSAGPPAS